LNEGKIPRCQINVKGAGAQISESNFGFTDLCMNECLWNRCVPANGHCFRGLSGSAFFDRQELLWEVAKIVAIQVELWTKDAIFT
jgi:hypothetical protein